MREPEASGPRPPAAGEGAPQPRPAAATPPPLTFPTAPGRIAVGRINGIWGMKGHVKVTSLTSNPERLKADATVIVRGRPCRIVEVVTPQGFPIIRFEGYPDRTAAERLRDTFIEIEAEELASLPEDEYYIDDLVGMEVVTTAGESIGRLTEVLGTGANDVYVVAREGKRDALVPAIAEVLISVDVAAKRMVIDPLPGLLD